MAIQSETWIKMRKRGKDAVTINNLAAKIEDVTV